MKPVLHPWCQPIIAHYSNYRVTSQNPMIYAPCDFRKRVGRGRWTAEMHDHSAQRLRWPRGDAPISSMPTAACDTAAPSPARRIARRTMRSATSPAGSRGERRVLREAGGAGEGGRWEARAPGAPAARSHSCGGLSEQSRDAFTAPRMFTYCSFGEAVVRRQRSRPKRAGVGPGAVSAERRQHGSDRGKSRAPDRR